MDDYIFKSERLGFRSWRIEDLPEMSRINADKEVMQFFPALLSRQQTLEFMERMQKMYEERGYCFFAVDQLLSGVLIGFIGLSQTVFEADFTPCTDIGWRIKRSEWQKGYATEGATACLNFAFNQLGLEKVHALAPVVNVSSERVMKKIGMSRVKTFVHPQLLSYDALKVCVLYQKVAPCVNKRLEG